nr:ribonuclease 3-like isoform X2 [Ipomoea trifida]
MNKFIPRFLLLTLSLASLSLLVFSAETTPDYFFIIFQWPKSKCESKEGCCLPKKGKPVLNDFIISEFKGVYAQEGSVPENCTTTTKFQPSKIADLVPNLGRYWPSLTCPRRDSKKLWKEEWVRYGSCAESVVDQHDYFAAALRAQKQINLLKLLGDAGIIPNGKYYPGEAINEAVRKAGLGDVAVTCREDENGLNTILDQVFLCATREGNKYTCPGAFWICDSRNGNKVKFLKP